MGELRYGTVRWNKGLAPRAAFWVWGGLVIAGQGACLLVAATGRILGERLSQTAILTQAIIFLIVAVLTFRAYTRWRKRRAGDN